MGGFAVKLADVAEQKLAPDLMKSVWGGVFNMETAMKQSKGGQFLLDTLKNKFHPEVEQQTSALVNHAKSMGSNMTPGEIKSIAKKNARAKIFGKNDEIIQGAVKAIENEKGKNHAQNIVDHMNVHLTDAPSEAGLSGLDSNLRRGGKRNENSSMYKPSPYSSVGSVEGALKGYQAATFAAKAVIPHSATQLNILLNDGAKSYFKALGEVITPNGYEGAKQMLIAHGAISEIALSEYEQIHAFKNGKIQKYLPGSVGEFISKNISMPGMSAMRQWTVTMAGVSAKHSAQEAAIRYAAGDYSMEPVLKEFNLDLRKIQAQQGKLLPEDLNKAIYHGVNNSVFLNGETGLHRNRWSQETATGRLTTAFHTYVTRQAGLVKRVLARDLIERKDPIAAARTLAMLGVVFPTVGNAIYEMERLGRGQDWKDNPAEKFMDREEKMYGKEGFVDAFLEHIESVAAVGSLGVATSYGRGVSRAHLANQLLGPVGNTAATTIEDLGKGAIAEYKGTKGHSAAKQLGRDAIQATPMAGLNAAAKHILLPTKQDEAASRPKTVRQMKSALKRKMKKKGGEFFNPNN